MKTLNKYVGLDVHKDTAVVAVAEGEVRLYGTRRETEGNGVWPWGLGLDQFFAELRAAAINPPAVIFVNPKPQGLTPFFPP